MRQEDELRLWHTYKDLLDQGRVTVHQEDDIIEILQSAWDSGHETGFEDAVELTSVQSYKEGFYDGQASVV